ncbi:hypothetical protein K450DRAFT_263968 [Umbelopsis ramanniana AG]|uniref:Uncharacterized protein n=1 Tax=Umbelopsis ramanniana AG TaxID=1314678 RepID=A0AAD5H6Z1_UMBRA|nr:uncharacterized protein K450DRAFT_263968 [Umbelopsis ramanniana AG]KAI8574965.1 hypothetical protein K450DRAFT_263968 [Umbelopsis ramanniana AG]
MRSTHSNTQTKSLNKPPTNGTQGFKHSIRFCALAYHQKERSFKHSDKSQNYHKKNHTLCCES